MLANLRAVEEEFELIPADTELDALQRSAVDPPDAVVVPDTLSELDLGQFVERLESESDVPVVVIGSTDDAFGSALVVSPEIPADVLIERLQWAIGDRTGDGSSDRYERFVRLAFDVLEATIDASDRGGIEAAIHDRLSTVPEFRFVWVARPDASGRQLELVSPDARTLSLSTMADWVGSPSAEHLRRRLSRAEVTAFGNVGGLRSHAGHRAEIEGASADVLAIPLTHQGTTLGVVLVGTDDAGALSDAERRLLGRLGALVGGSLARAQRPEPGLDRNLGRINEFVHVLAHELRNPLAVATGYVEIAREHEDFDALDRVENAHDQIEAIIDTVRQVFDSDDLDALEPVDVADVAEAAWSELASEGGDLRFPDSPTVRADRELLDRVFSNLLRNALDHAGPDVTVRVGALEHGRGFYVEDDGPGIPKRDRDVIFRWGYSTSGENMGIGLGFVREIVEAHGWHIVAAEGVDGGARFEIYTSGEPDRSEESRSGLRELFEEWSSSSGGVLSDSAG